MAQRRLLIVIGGGIAAYKILELIRRAQDQGLAVRCVMTAAARQFVTPLAVAALAGERVYEDLFSLTDEAEMGHIRLARDADLVLVAPATADLMAKMAGGRADDLAATILLATDRPVLVAPAMNPVMWANPRTRANVATLLADGLRFVGPEAGDMACGEVGSGRLSPPEAILAAVLAILEPPAAGPLAGRRALVTSGPTHEAIDPVRFIANASSGRQGHAIAAALRDAGAAVQLVTGPVDLPDPPGMHVVHVTTAREMAEACTAALPVDVAFCVAAVADWRPATVAPVKLKKGDGGPPRLELVANPDILAGLAHGPQRPGLLVGFAAETDDVLAHAAAKLASKGCDWLVANAVGPGTGTFGGATNEVTLLRRGAPPEPWPRLTKAEVATRLVRLAAAALAEPAP